MASSARYKLIAACIAGLFLLTGLLVQAQEKSLADIARESKAKKAAAKTPPKVYNDDNLPKSSTAAATSAPAESAKADDKTTTPAVETGHAPSPGENNPEALRTAIYAQKKRVADLEDEVNRLERDNRTLVAQDDADKNRRPTTCGAGTFCMETGEIAGKRQDYDKQHGAKQAELAAARKKLDDMEQDARKRANNSQ